MIITVKHGNVLDIRADVLITPANPWLTMSSGVNGEIVGRCGMAIQEELNAYLQDCGLKAVPGGTVVPTQALGLPFKHLIHAVAVDAFEESSQTLVAKTLSAAFRLIEAFAVDSVSVPPLASGYGPISMQSFIAAMGHALLEQTGFAERLQLIVEDEEMEEKARAMLEELDLNPTVKLR